MQHRPRALVFEEEGDPLEDAKVFDKLPTPTLAAPLPELPLSRTASGFSSGLSSAEQVALPSSSGFTSSGLSGGGLSVLSRGLGCGRRLLQVR